MNGHLFLKFETAIRGAIAIVGTAVLTSAACFAVGIAISLAGNAGWFHLGEYQPWLPLIGLEDGFVLGLVLGVILRVRSRRSP